MKIYNFFVILKFYEIFEFFAILENFEILTFFVYYTSGNGGAQCCPFVERKTYLFSTCWLLNATENINPR
jgi:hypothetical protein